MQLVKLTCFGQVLGNTAIVFTSQEQIRPQRFDLFALPAELLDTRGPGRLIPDRLSEKLVFCAIEIGGGTVMPSIKDPKVMHWEKGRFSDCSTKIRFHLDDKILIARAQQNISCPSDQLQSWPTCIDQLATLGTRQNYWQKSQKQAAVQAGQYVVAQFTTTWIKQEKITMKDIHLNDTADTIRVPFLESRWGLRISLCTGVARRVPMREMLADVMGVYVEKRLPIPPEWEILLQGHEFVDQLRGPRLKEWFHRLPSSLQSSAIHLIRYVLEALRETGYDEPSDEFVIAWLFPNDPFRCFRIQSKGHHMWTRALADSSSCATFAYITPKCLEADEYTCQNCTAIQWQQALSLDTAVCQHRSNNEVLISTSIWSLQPGISYWIGKPGGELTARLVDTTSPLGMRLAIKRSQIPAHSRMRLGRIDRIRERQQSTDVHATPVLIVAAKWHVLHTLCATGLR
ncbi:hypothetical protein EJ08DRAFT_696151 [Tothia fuscella]|uniref:Uncharacterized protein n=1 Tax=Tothia fuscella TaxID=1048955 RepID=A0A9P4NUT8_9PEZI|nr:hypothetical protein EJ08DRAFT_696151 [Tothia fuscella]